MTVCPETIALMILLLFMATVNKCLWNRPEKVFAVSLTTFFMWKILQNKLHFLPISTDKMDLLYMKEIDLEKKTGSLCITENSQDIFENLNHWKMILSCYYNDAIILTNVNVKDIDLVPHSTVTHNIHEITWAFVLSQSCLTFLCQYWKL